MKETTMPGDTITWPDATGANGGYLAINNELSAIRAEYTNPQVLDVRLVDGQIEVLRCVEIHNGWNFCVERRKEWQKGGTSA